MQSNPVLIGSDEHLIPIILVVILTVGIIYLAKHKLNGYKKNLLFNILGFSVSFSIIVFHLWKIFTGEYSLQNDLPLYLCSFLALVIPVFTFSRKYWMFEILVFIIIAGTTQAVITPDIPEGFPSFGYFRYWYAHLGLLIIIFYAIFVYKMRPTIKSVFRSFLALNLYMLVIFMLNLLLEANYSYLMKKPESASALDLFHEWPYYIFEIELIGTFKDNFIHTLAAMIWKGYLLFP